MTKRIIIDTDPGVDDALTFLLALASPEIKLEALTTVQGNVTIEKATRNALSVLELAKASHIPVVQGCSHPLIKTPHNSGEAVHGESGIGKSILPEPTSKPMDGHAVDYLIERVLAEPGELSIFPIGPLTNIALAIRKEPRFAKAVKELVTPYTPGGEVDYAHARRLATHLVRSGNDGLVLAGTTGEAPLLSDEEKFRLWSEVKQELGDSATVVAGAGTNDTRHSIHLSHEAERAGVDGILAVVPYYLKPPQEGIFQHFRALQSPMPLRRRVANVRWPR